MHIFTPSPQLQNEIIAELVAYNFQKLKHVKQSLRVAKSLTSRGVMATVTSVPGSSAVFYGGVITYAAALEQGLLVWMKI